jgi:1,2-dihydroxy-3-keto-5-methylthiopentene dioxygenase
MKALWMDSGAEITPAELNSHGIFSRTLPTEPESYQQALDQLMSERGYLTQDQVVLRPDMPHLDELCEKFIEEHLHAEDEVRFVLAGSGVFEIRSGDDRWMRVVVGKGDAIIVPENRYHRFYLTEERMIQCVRLFKDSAGWTPVYRKQRELQPSAR